MPDATKKKFDALLEGEAAKHETLEVSGDGDGEVLFLRSRTIHTVEDALAEAKVDTAIWEVERYLINKWDSAAKLKRPGGERLAATELWQVKIWLKRRAPKHVQDGIQALCERLKNYKPPKASRSRKKGGELLEVSLFDSHFGKLCWGAETGTDYDTHISEKIYQNAVEDLISRVEGSRIEKIWFPIGNDFFHVNNWQQTTEKGTPQDHDGRFAKVFEIGEMALVRAIDTCRQVAPVELFWIPGNHDPATSYYMLRVLNATYSGSGDVTVDVSPMPRKAKVFGKCFVLFTHGDEEPHRDLPTIAATSYPQEWAATSFREAHTAHYHKKKEVRTVDVDEFQGFRHRILPSLSGTDRWHFGRGYVNSRRAAEAYLWDAEQGYVGHFSVNARE